MQAALPLQVEKAASYLSPTPYCPTEAALCMELDSRQKSVTE